MAADLSASAEAPRRPQRGTPGVFGLEGGMVRLSNSDTTWAEDLVRRLHDKDAASEAYWLREHALDIDVDLYLPDPTAARAAISDMRQDLAQVAVDSASGTAVVLLQDVHPSFAVLVRRALMTRIPVLAIVEVVILENTSGVIDEMVAHRLGQLALKTGVVDNGTREGDVRVKGRPVRAKDICFRSQEDVVEVCDADREVVVVSLMKDQCFTARLTARYGIGLEHAKFSAVAAVAYREQHSLAELPDNDDALEALARAGFSLAENDGGDIVVERPDGLPVRRERLEEVVKSLVFRPCRCFRLTVEPLGQWTAPECVFLAVSAVLRELSALEEVLLLTAGDA